MMNLETRQALISLRIQQAEKTILDVEICIAQNLLGACRQPDLLRDVLCHACLGFVAGF